MEQLLSDSASRCCILTVAGTDSSGGAGVLADIKTFTAHGCYGCSAITAVTAQNTTGVQSIHPCPPAVVAQQMQSIFDDLSIRAIKTGMLVDKTTIETVVDILISKYPTSPRPPIVVDPVMVATSGHVLLDSGSIDILRDRLLPLATVVTPNIPEAELILSHRRSNSFKITCLQEMVAAAQAIAQLGPSSVLLKGGHLILSSTDVEVFVDTGDYVVEWSDNCGPNNALILTGKDFHAKLDENVVVDVLYSIQTLMSDDEDEPLMGNLVIFASPRIDTSSTHGTGCTLSAALACQLAKGSDVRSAIHHAMLYTHIGIATAPSLGKGHGPLNHMHPIIPRMISGPNWVHPTPFISKLIRSAPKLWKNYVQHTFVIQLGKGTLPRANFVHFIKQDYHYLKHYARAYGLLASKSNTYEAIDSSSKTIQHIIRESSMHVSFCKAWGISEEELMNTAESPALLCYAAYLIDTGLRGDDTTLLVALASCLLGYGEVGLWLKKQTSTGGNGFYLEGNIYKKWIDDYAGEEYQRAVQSGIKSLEQRIARNPPSPDKYKELQEIWKSVLKLEIGFWDMAMGLL